ncbi:MAG: hypothetical protein KKF44_07780 [Nanoarchaeota archaeon]|nr:hypothetical protein [Nanoarchaeota archaeon]
MGQPENEGLEDSLKIVGALYNLSHTLNIATFYSYEMETAHRLLRDKKLSNLLVNLENSPDIEKNHQGLKSLAMGAVINEISETVARMSTWYRDARRIFTEDMGIIYDIKTSLDAYDLDLKLTIDDKTYGGGETDKTERYVTRVTVSKDKLDALLAQDDITLRVHAFVDEVIIDRPGTKYDDLITMVKRLEGPRMYQDLDTNTYYFETFSPLDDYETPKGEFSCKSVMELMEKFTAFELQDYQKVQ